MLQDYLNWPYAEQVFRLEREFVRLADGKEMKEVSYGVTSLSREEADADRLLQLSRGHWGIENKLHYRRDDTLHEDRCRRKGQAARRWPCLPTSCSVCSETRASQSCQMFVAIMPRTCMRQPLWSSGRQGDFATALLFGGNAAAREGAAGRPGQRSSRTSRARLLPVAWTMSRDRDPAPASCRDRGGLQAG